MDAERAATAAALARLLGEVADDRSAMRRRASDLDEAARRLAATPGDAGGLALQAWALHGWYTALESVLERVARQLDAEVPTGDRWHRELLAQVSVDVPGIRPPVLPRALLPDLVELLSIRHFLRHAYGTELDPARLAAQAARVHRVAPTVEAALDAFARFVDDARSAVTL